MKYQYSTTVKAEQLKAGQLFSHNERNPWKVISTCGHDGVTLTIHAQNVKSNRVKSFIFGCLVDVDLVVK